MVSIPIVVVRVTTAVFPLGFVILWRLWHQPYATLKFIAGFILYLFVTRSWILRCPTRTKDDVIKQYNCNYSLAWSTST
jgi:hypothetical protein